MYLSKVAAQRRNASALASSAPSWRKTARALMQQEGKLHCCPANSEWRNRYLAVASRCVRHRAGSCGGVQGDHPSNDQYTIKQVLQKHNTSYEIMLCRSQLVQARPWWE